MTITGTPAPILGFIVVTESLGTDVSKTWRLPVGPLAYYQRNGSTWVRSPLTGQILVKESFEEIDAMVMAQQTAPLEAPGCLDDAECDMVINAARQLGAENSDARWPQCIRDDVRRALAPYLRAPQPVYGYSVTDQNENHRQLIVDPSKSGREAARRLADGFGLGSEVHPLYDGGAIYVAADGKHDRVAGWVTP